jgi:hypothetical protein
MNLIAFTGTIIVVGAALLFDLFRFVPSGAFNEHFGYLLLYFASLRIAVNLIFPFEVFLLYRSTLRIDSMLLVGTLVCLTLLGVGLMSLTNAFLIITMVELMWLVWRVISWWILTYGAKQNVV